ncbi:MAG TPA: hypothetical protein VFB73_15215 [Chloroflexota bacterium]|nr:hypothetical protein [Chloroflexota bacterium]
MGSNLANRLGALVAGALDADVMDPAGAALAEREGFRILADWSHVVPVPLQGVVTTEVLIKDQRPPLRAFLKGVVRGLRLTKENPQEVAGIAMRGLGLDMDEATALCAVFISWERPGYADDNALAAFYGYEIRRPLGLSEDQPLPTLHDFSILMEVYDELKISEPQ